MKNNRAAVDERWHNRRQGALNPEMFYKHGHRVTRTSQNTLSERAEPGSRRAATRSLKCRSSLTFVS